MNLRDLFSNPKPLIGMVHLLPLPGSPDFDGDLDTVIERAINDAQTLEAASFDGLIVENFGDLPYVVGRGPVAQIVAMTVALREVRRATHVPLGVNVQFNDYEAEIAIARYGGASFIRVEVFVDNVLTTGGPCYACAPELQRLRALLLGPPVYLFTDVQVKETTPLVSVPLSTSVQNAEYAGADALIVTGSATGTATPLEAVKEAKAHTSLPILIGSGFNPDNAREAMSVADGAIVGTATKVGGVVTNPVDAQAAETIVQAARGNSS